MAGTKARTNGTSKTGPQVEPVSKPSGLVLTPDPERAARERELGEIDRALLELPRFVASTAEVLLDRSPSGESHRERVRRSLARVWRAALNLEGADGAPYPDARMHFAAAVFAEARAHDSSPDAAKRTVAFVAVSFPELWSRLFEPARLEMIQYAIRANEGRKRNWIATVKCWEGIEAGEQDPENWRSAWNKNRRSE
jgi:hypothetical protein